MSWRFALIFSLFLGSISAFPEAGRFSLNLNSSRPYNGIVKNVYNGTKLYIKVHCDSQSLDKPQIQIGWVLRETVCWNEYLVLEFAIFETYYRSPNAGFYLQSDFVNKTNYAKSTESTHTCDSVINLPDFVPAKENPRQIRAAKETDFKPVAPTGTDPPQFTINHDGDYLFVIHIQGPDPKGQISSEFEATVEVDFLGPRGYLSIVDWPMLPFYGLMCGLYVAMGLGWLVVCSLHWRDLLRIQFWIGAVIFLGMLEKALFYAEYQNINSTGLPTRALIVTAEIVSCAKKTLARMLVIIVSLGFGIVKPRLGPTLHRVVGIGFLYFIIASTEAVLRVVKPKNDLSSGTILASIPLAVIDSSICWWVFSALVQTTRTLRLRRNLVKLSLYRHFTNTLVFAVMASVIFMLWSIKFHRLEECLIDWRDLWIDDAFWHLLFSVILLVIMVLWTPSKNNQRYAFTPLLDNEEDEEEEDALLNDAYEGMKLRSKSRHGSGEENGSIARKADEEDPLKWIEENIPESAENPLPIIDSDEEIETTKLEINKMQ